MGKFKQLYGSVVKSNSESSRQPILEDKKIEFESKHAFLNIVRAAKRKFVSKVVKSLVNIIERDLDQSQNINIKSTNVPYTVDAFVNGKDTAWMIEIKEGKEVFAGKLIVEEFSEESRGKEIIFQKDVNLKHESVSSLTTHVSNDIINKIKNRIGS